MAHAPPGHHSVIGRPNSGGLCYPEYVVYRGEQVSVCLGILSENDVKVFKYSQFLKFCIIWKYIGGSNSKSLWNCFGIAILGMIQKNLKLSVF